MDKRVVMPSSNKVQVLHRTTTNARHERRKAAALAREAERTRSIIEGFRPPSATPVKLDPILAHLKNKRAAGTLATGEHNHKKGPRYLARLWRRRQEVRRVVASFKEIEEREQAKEDAIRNEEIRITEHQNKRMAWKNMMERERSINEIVKEYK